MQVSLSSLAVDEIANVRKTGRGAEPIFVASIRAKGIIEPLTVRPSGDRYLVVNGGKRLAALQWMAERVEVAAGVPVTPDYPVPVTIRDENDAEARDTSLITNVVRAGMHPVDEFEAFVALVEDGMSVADVAARYALEEKQVRQRLALGQLAPKVRDAWRAGEIGADQAKAFTLGADEDQQTKLFDRLTKSGQLRWGAHVIREQLVGKQGDVGKFVAFVGADQLRAAGVDLREDLFGTSHTVPDPKVVKKLADDKLAAECGRLVAEGWGWASVETDLPSGARWSWSALPPKKMKPKPNQKEMARLTEIDARLEALNYEPADDEVADEENATLIEERASIEKAIAARAYSAEDKARSGCIVSIGHRGELDVKYAVLKPEQAKNEKARERAKDREKEKKRREAAGEPAEPEDEGPAISNALAHDLSVRLTRAVQSSLQGERQVALAALLAGFLAYGPMRVQHTGFGWQAARHSDREDYSAAFGRLKAMTVDQLLEVAAGVAGTAIDLQSYNAASHPMQDGNIAGLVNAIDYERLELALDDQFDPEDFFKRASAKVAIAALVDIDGRNSCLSKKKPDIAALAASKSRETGWLPVQLRTAHYAGPGAKWTPATIEAEGENLRHGDSEDQDDE